MCYSYINVSIVKKGNSAVLSFTKESVAFLNNVILSVAANTSQYDNRRHAHTHKHTCVVVISAVFRQDSIEEVSLCLSVMILFA